MSQTSSAPRSLVLACKFLRRLRRRARGRGGGVLLGGGRRRRGRGVLPQRHLQRRADLRRRQVQTQKGGGGGAVELHRHHLQHGQHLGHGRGTSGHGRRLAAPPRPAPPPRPARPGPATATSSGLAGDTAAPVFLDFGTNVTSITAGESVTFTAVLTDTNGIGSLVGGALTDQNNATYGAFQASGQMGSFRAHRLVGADEPGRDDRLRLRRQRDADVHRQVLRHERHERPDVDPDYPDVQRPPGRRGRLLRHHERPHQLRHGRQDVQRQHDPVLPRRVRHAGRLRDHDDLVQRGVRGRGQGLRERVLRT